MYMSPHYASQAWPGVDRRDSRKFGTAAVAHSYYDDDCHSLIYITFTVANRNYMLVQVLYMCSRHSYSSLSIHDMTCCVLKI